MALVSKLASASSTVASSAPRPAASARVASVRAGPVEEASISTGTFFDTSPYEYTDGQQQARNDDNRNGRQAAPKRIHFGTLNATSEVFASLLDRDSRGDVTDDFGNVHQKTYPSIVSQAINRYELNSKVISGTQSELGMEISLTL